MLSLQEEILNRLQKEILSAEFDRYAKQLKFNEKNSKPDFIVYNVTNEIIAKFIQTKYAKTLEKLWEEKTGIKPLVKITSKTRISQKDQNPKTEKPKSSVMIVSYSFDNFIVGDSNRFAYSSAKLVAENSELNDDRKINQFNPLFIHGPSGLGKTHLLQSIGNYAISKGKTVLCITSEQFANDLRFHIENKITDKFKTKYRNCDFLLIDDIQFLVGREKAKEEFFNTFNELKKKNCQIVMTSDCKPIYLKGFEERLISRFDSGLTVDIAPPDLETKIAIIRRKSEDNSIILAKDVIEYIATSMGDNIREIEGIINQIMAYSRLIRSEIPLEAVKNFVQDKIKEKKEQVSLENILNIIAKELNIKPSDIKNGKRHKNIAEARRIAIYLAKNLTTNSSTQIAMFFGLKDHSAVVKSNKKANETIVVNDKFRLKVEEIKNKIQRKKD